MSKFKKFTIVSIGFLLIAVGCARASTPENADEIYKSPNGAFTVVQPKLLQPGGKVSENASLGRVDVSFSDDAGRYFLIQVFQFERGVDINFEELVHQNEISRLESIGAKQIKSNKLVLPLGEAIHITYKEPGGPCQQATTSQAASANCTTADMVIDLYLIDAKDKVVRMGFARAPSAEMFADLYTGRSGMEDFKRMVESLKFLN